MLTVLNCNYSQLCHLMLQTTPSQQYLLYYLYTVGAHLYTLLMAMYGIFSILNWTKLKFLNSCKSKTIPWNYVKFSNYGGV